MSCPKRFAISKHHRYSGVIVVVNAQGVVYGQTQRFASWRSQFACTANPEWHTVRANPAHQGAARSVIQNALAALSD
jgi:hypothetical protein